MNVQLLKPFIDGTIHTMKVQLKVDVKVGKPYLKSAGQTKPRVDIAGIVGIMSTGLKGNICLCFPEATFLAAMERMLGEKYPSISEEIADGAGELMNMIFGFAKRVLNDGGNDLQKALPSVITGENIRITQKNNHTVIVLPFESEIGAFQLELGIDQTGD
jgi:chemotaxis protein CheX